jgi:hypothetical protein
MKFRTTLIMLAVFLAAGSYVYFYEMKGGESREAEKEASEKLLMFNKDAVSTMTLTHSGITLKKNAGKWTIVAPVQAAAEEFAVPNLLSSLESAKRERGFTESASGLATFGLGPTATAIILSDSVKSDTIFAGDKNLTGASVFTRINSDSTVYLTSSSLLASAQKSLFDLRDKSLLFFEVNEATSMKLRTPDLACEVKKEDGLWMLRKPLQARADESKVTQLLNRVRNGRMMRVIDEEPADLKKYGLDKPLYELEVRHGSDNAIKTLRVGKRDKYLYFAQDLSRPPVVALDSAIVRDFDVKLFDLRERRLADFQSWEADEIILEYPGQRIACRKDTAGTWYLTMPDSGKAKNWKISEITGAATSLKADTFIDNPSKSGLTGVDQPRAKLLVKIKGNEAANISFGKKEKAMVFAKSPLQPGIVMVKEADTDKFFVTSKDLLEETKP